MAKIKDLKEKEQRKQEIKKWLKQELIYGLIYCLAWILFAIFILKPMVVDYLMKT